MIKSRIVIILITLFLFFSCKEENKTIPLGNYSISRIESYSVGYPNITFQVNQDESDLRGQKAEIISSKEKLNEIDSLLLTLDSLSGSIKIGSLMGLSDFYFGKSKATLYYDGVFIHHSGRVYVPNEKLLNLLYD